ncbi:MAG: cysteine desulfurase NifS [Pseudodesulfovibrio sp.]|uniref:Cysteine desulfurase n=1 Tax=Pseudodesulfovibrio aespoeensis (strain ATCC 700646 / DSM 10631 / Aspo-2) TaxID=643562 RepID=E6VYF4_PSEA9|nr:MULTISPECIES: cysteine desulfurase NifS [Pseudodesulfovibrio]MBU4192706.1 cysteine desulfurase NifS [Pseudomonadota bacterium]ADU62717.1 cysteine desulfurase NifS [Pseudodesulfovibrio aespoeensis Aspo-2]MBU4243619.1 cysteine desulfurase NifS [Pseudomonadota bacterium]MBU4378490.1 cysteine desulfurase NifS [Pseudomonadota bacterium]MBU4476291.1 cysteine desulfurase NifS [Pseudomonadota bacterium]
MKTIYMDNNATTQVDPAVFEEMKPFFTELYGNPSSMHRFGGQVGVKLKEARARVATLLNCEPDEIIFTSCGSESDNTAIRSALSAQPDKRHIITTRVEHPAILSLCKFLEKKDGYDVTYLGTDEQGRLDMDEFKAAIRPDTAIISVMWANNETGNIYPVEAMAAIARERGVIFHTDAVQAVGKIPIDLKTTPIDMLSLSGHKLHAPKGVGALFVRKRLPFRPFLIGGHQERSRRAGTENTTGIIALGKACELAAAHMAEENTAVKALRDRLEAGLLTRVPDSILNGDKDNRLPNTTNISFGYVEGEAILLMMDQLGICASSGSACTSGSLEPSHVLRAMGVPFTFAHGSIRFSLSRFNTDEEVDSVLDTLPSIIDNLRKLSPFSAEKQAPACTKAFTE